MLHFKRIVHTALIATSVVLSGHAYAEKLRLEFWTQSLSPKFDPYFKDIVAKYNAAHPNVNVVWTDYPWSVIRTKFTAALAGGNPPALVNLDVPWVYSYKQLGLLRPVDDLINKDAYLGGALADTTFDGKQWAFPFYNGANVIAYNTDLFKQAGLDPKKPPTTLTQQLDYAKQIRARTGVAGFAPALGPTKVEGLMAAEGLDVMKDGHAVFNSPAHVAFVQKLADAYKAGALLKDNLFSQDNFQVQMAAYDSDRLAMLVTVPTALTRVRTDAPEIYKATDVVGIPLGPEKVVWSGWQFTFAIAKNVDPRLVPEIGKLATYLTSAENQLAFAKQAGTLPTSRGAATDPYFHIVGPDAGAAEKGLVAAASNVEYTRTIFLKGVRNAEMLSTKLSAAVEQAVTGRKDPKEALDEAVAFWNQKLAVQ
ncbi:MAG: extracellular solute-binding protein [Burkholderiales bacterium]|nr:extracellular solute-binding protein [Burkholderiales bacterium]